MVEEPEKVSFKPKGLQWLIRIFSCLWSLPLFAVGWQNSECRGEPVHISSWGYKYVFEFVTTYVWYSWVYIWAQNGSFVHHTVKDTFCAENVHRTLKCTFWAQMTILYTALSRVRFELKMVHHAIYTIIICTDNSWSRFYFHRKPDSIDKACAEQRHEGKFSSLSLSLSLSLSSPLLPSIKLVIRLSLSQLAGWYSNQPRHPSRRRFALRW